MKSNISLKCALARFFGILPLLFYPDLDPSPVLEVAGRRRFHFRRISILGDEIHRVILGLEIRVKGGGIHPPFSAAAPTKFALISSIFTIFSAFPKWLLTAEALGVKLFYHE